MKVFSAQQLQQADRFSIEKEGISSTELMERAASLVFREIHRQLEGRKVPVKVFCGIGNNGGDGLVIARLLLEQGFEVSVYVVNYSDKRSRDFLINYDRFKNVSRNWPVILREGDPVPELSPEDLVVDAVFGIGLNRPLDAWVGLLLGHISASEAFILSVDVPSGMFIDSATPKDASGIKADITLTFQAPKLPFFLPATGPKVGVLEILDIGLDREFLSGLPEVGTLVQLPKVAELYRARQKFSHKGTYGHALLVGGSYGKMGSICLTSTACLRSGAGMATAFVPRSGYGILQSVVPEAMVITDGEEEFLSDIQVGFEPKVTCFGVGAGKKAETLGAFKRLLERTEAPMVIDADGLNLLAEHPELLENLPPQSLLTPHPKELERLIGSWEDDFQKLEMARSFARRHKVVLVLKDAHSIIIDSEGMHINNTGNPGMATAGSGDVLAGVLTGLLSQGYGPLEAAVLGVYVHGRAGDIAAGALGYEGMIAGDIAAQLGPAFRELNVKLTE